MRLPAVSTAVGKHRSAFYGIVLLLPQRKEAFRAELPPLTWRASGPASLVWQSVATIGHFEMVTRQRRRPRATSAGVGWQRHLVAPVSCLVVGGGGSPNQLGSAVCASDMSPELG